MLIDGGSRIASYCQRHGIVIALVAATLALEMFIAARSPVIAPDGIRFIAIAQELEQSPLAAMKHYDQHAGYPALTLAARRSLLGWMAADAAWVHAARLVSAVCGAAGVVVIWLLARQIGSAAVAHLSAGLYALLPVLRQNAADALSDSPHLLLYLTAVLLVVLGLVRRSTWLFLAAGACAALAFLIRPEGLGVAIVAAISAAILPSWWRQLGWRKICGACAALSLGAALLVVPYVALSGKLSGKLTSKVGWPKSQHHSNSPAAKRPARAPAAPLVHLTPIAYSAPVTDVSWPSALAKGTVVFGERLGDCLRWVLLAPLAIGAVLTLGHRDRAKLQFLWVLSLFNIALLLLLYCIAGYIDRRHVMPLVGLLLPTIAGGLIYIAEAAQRVTLVRRHPQLAAGLALTALTLVLLPRTIRPLHTTHLHKLAVAQRLDELAAPGDTVLSNSAHVIYYATLRGNIAGGVSLINGVPDDGPTQPGGHRFAVIEQGGPLFHPAWRQELEASYAPIATIAGDASRDQNEVVIYELRTMVGSATDAASLR